MLKELNVTYERGDATTDLPAEAPGTDEAKNTQATGAEPTGTPWPSFIATAQNSDIKKRFAVEAAEIIGVHLQSSPSMLNYCVLALLEPENSIDAGLDQIFNALCELNPGRDKDVLLLLLSRGGSIEPAYQISKLCKSFSKDRFVALVPRQAKSAATLIAIGADEIHMGPLGQLGPIDPQLGSLPALGVSQALKTIASVSQEFPGSAEMFARYLRMTVTVEQIGYCDRISESAVQYAVRLLSTKPNLARRAEQIAKELVHEYKDHGFVIDFEEAKVHLGQDWVKTESPELVLAEAIYSHFEMVNFFLQFGPSKRLIISGGLTRPESMMVLNRKQ